MYTPENEEKDMIERAISEIEHSKTHVAMFNNVAVRISRWIDEEIAALQNSKQVYNMMGKTEFVEMIERRIVEAKNLTEELNECGENISGDMTSIFSMVSDIIFTDEEGENDDNDLP